MGSCRRVLSRMTTVIPSGHAFEPPYGARNIFCSHSSKLLRNGRGTHYKTTILYIGVIVKIMVPFWVLSIVRNLKFRGPERGP